MAPVRSSSRRTPRSVYQPLEPISRNSPVTPSLPQHPANPLIPVINQGYSEEPSTPTLLGHGNLSDSTIPTAGAMHLGPLPLINRSAPIPELTHSSTAPLTNPPPSQHHHAHTQLQPPRRGRQPLNSVHGLLICALKLFVTRHGDDEPLDDDTISMIMTVLYPNNGEPFICNGIYDHLVNNKYTEDPPVHEIWRELDRNALFWQETAQRYYWQWMESMKAVWMQLWSNGQQDYLRAQLGCDSSRAHHERKFQMLHEWAKRAQPPRHLML